jgi:hypothetical protein
LYANTVRFASAMGGGGDYVVHAGGRYQLSKTVLEPGDWLAVPRRLFPDRLETGRQKTFK